MIVVILDSVCRWKVLSLPRNDVQLLKPLIDMSQTSVLVSMDTVNMAMLGLNTILCNSCFSLSRHSFIFCVSILNHVTLLQRQLMNGVNLKMLLLGLD